MRYSGRIQIWVVDGLRVYNTLAEGPSMVNISDLGGWYTFIYKGKPRVLRGVYKDDKYIHGEQVLGSSDSGYGSDKRYRIDEITELSVATPAIKDGITFTDRGFDQDEILDNISTMRI